MTADQQPKIIDGAEQEVLVRRNLARSRVIVLIAFMANAGLNLILLGILTRLGGLELVGDWSFLNAILLFVLLADFGITNALTYQIGLEGIKAAAPKLRTLLLVLTVVAMLFMVAAIFADRINAAWGLPLCLTVLAGVAQLASNWLIAIRMGQHEQYWFNVKTVLRVVVQTGAALGLYFAMPAQSKLAFSGALLLGAIAEILLAQWMIRKHFRLRGPLSPMIHIVIMTKGFGVLALVQRALDPLSRLLISVIAGPTTLGVFTVAQRIPAVINQSISAALRGLLPGLSQMQGDIDRERVIQLLCDAVFGQIVMVGMPMLAIAIHAGSLFEFWLGHSSLELEISLRALLIGTFIMGITTPLYWTAQAFGNTKQLAHLTLIRVVITLFLGSTLLIIWQNVVLFSIIYSLSQASIGIIAFRLANRHDVLASKVFSHLPLLHIIAFLSITVFLNLFLASSLEEVSPSLSLLVVGFVNTIALWAISMHLTKSPHKSKCD
ncbi:lipopolysaccharide biosynthesis protein [Thiorhodococcus fuscus]|uniref:Lipopolysaccharide biosynthesis protein n=1 Tax=Thiorhodococcus fuscus TaxID=527200 RepID=A0ABW4YBZ6_9GAMM